jgi:hypothetical protein
MKKNKYINKIYVIALCVVMYIATASATHAAVYHISTTGNDWNNGSASSPWRTIQKCANTINGGDSCIVEDGTYSENINISRAGSPGNLITIQAANKWKAIINGIVAIAGSYIKLDGFKVLKQDGQVTTLSVSGSYNMASNNYIGLKPSWIPPTNTNYNINLSGIYNTVDSNYTYDGCQGATIAGDYNTFSNNEIVRPKMYSPSCGDVDYARVFGTYHVISGNYFHGAVAGEVGNAHLDGFQSFDNGGQTLANVVFEKNRIYDAYNSCFILSMTVNKSESNTGNIIRNNVCHSKGNWGLDARYCSIEVYNNTFVIDGSGYFFYLTGYGNHYLKVRNNITVATNAVSVSPSPYSCVNAIMGTDCKDNLHYAVNFSARYSAISYPYDILNTDPKLVSHSMKNYRLQQNSPAIKAASSIYGFSSDIVGVPRLQGQAWDIGAYEYSNRNIGAPANFRKVGP